MFFKRVMFQLTTGEDKIFTLHGFISLATRTTLILSRILEKSLLKSKKAHIYTKRCQSPWSQTHSDIISSKPIVQAHDTLSHFWLMIQAHESHWRNFRSHDLEGQEVCTVKLQRFKVDKGKHVVWHVFPNSLNSDGSVCNKWHLVSPHIT